MASYIGSTPWVHRKLVLPGPPPRSTSAVAPEPPPKLLAEERDGMESEKGKKKRERKREREEMRLTGGPPVRRWTEERPWKRRRSDGGELETKRDARAAIHKEWRRGEERERMERNEGIGRLARVQVQ